jgi:hypothetical protein
MINSLFRETVNNHRIIGQKQINAKTTQVSLTEIASSKLNDRAKDKGTKGTRDGTRINNNIPNNIDHPKRQQHPTPNNNNNNNNSALRRK